MFLISQESYRRSLKVCSMTKRETSLESVVVVIFGQARQKDRFIRVLSRENKGEFLSRSSKLSPRSTRPRSSFESAPVPRSTDSRPPPMVARSSTPGSRSCSLSGSPSACSAPSSRWARASSSSDYPRRGSSSAPSCTSPARPPEIREFFRVLRPNIK